MVLKKLEDNFHIPREELKDARLCGNYGSKDLGEAIRMLAQAGFSVYASPVAWTGIELWYGSYHYTGMHDIREFVRYYEKNHEILYPKKLL
jgi:pyridoxal biosynthesis lyase PdxS